MLFREYFCFNALILNPIFQKPPGPSGPGGFIQPITINRFCFTAETKAVDIISQPERDGASWPKG